jgi:exodeoxyribonuclease VII small subunit
MADKLPDVATLTYEEARDELVAIVDSLEKGTASLDESVALWERGEALAKRCEEWLAGARQRLDAARKPAE